LPGKNKAKMALHDTDMAHNIDVTPVVSTVTIRGRVC